MIAIVDAGPLYSATVRQDRNHERCARVLRRLDLELIVPALAIAEVCWLLGQRHGPLAEAAFVRGIASVEIEAPTSEDLAAMGNLIERYSDFPLGGADAFVAVLAERLGTDVIITLDRRHFGALRTSSGRPFTLLPE